MHLPPAYLQAGTNTEKAAIAIGQQPGDKGGMMIAMHGISKRECRKYPGQRCVHGAHGLHGGLRKHIKTYMGAWYEHLASIHALSITSMPHSRQHACHAGGLPIQ
jgi:hypothetical protein